MTLDQFITTYSGKKIDFDGAYGGQCVDLYRQYVKEVLNYPQSPKVVGAAEIYDTASNDYYLKIRNSETNVPLKGDIVIWNKNAGGGGGGAGDTYGAGGAGGGGRGGNQTTHPVAGTANSGGGGGGGRYNNSYNVGAAGGSGIVIIRYLDGAFDNDTGNFFAMF